jgi:serine/threonine protein kinase
MNEPLSTQESLHLSAGASLCNDQYVVKQRLGGGKYAEVYLAIDRRIEGTDGGEPRVAIKIPRPKYWENEEARQRLRREGRLQRAEHLGRHNKIVSVLRTDTLTQSTTGRQAAQVPLLVMEYVEHITLDDYLRRHGGAAPLDETFATMMGQLASALDWIHTNNPCIVHRDLAPHNILLRCTRDEAGSHLLVQRDDFVQLTDFGLAFVESERRITQDDQYERRRIAANLCYASPEILYGEPPTAQDDIYSLGALTFRMLTGRLAFPCRQLSTERDLWDYAQLVEETPVMFPDPEAVPDTVQEIVIQAMAKTRSERYKRAREMADDLRSALQPPRTLAAAVPVPVAGPEVEDDASANGEKDNTPLASLTPSATDDAETDDAETGDSEIDDSEADASAADAEEMSKLGRGLKKLWGCLARLIGLTLVLGLALTLVTALVVGALVKDWPNRDKPETPAVQLTPVTGSDTYLTPTASSPGEAETEGPTTPPITQPAGISPNTSPLESQAERVDYAYVSQTGTPMDLIGAPVTGETSEPSIFRAGSALREPAWSPTADLLAYVSEEDGAPGIYVTDGLTSRRLSPDGVEEHWPTWSQDGQRMLVATHEGESSHLSHIELNTGTHEPLTGPYFNAWAPAWSPQEAYVAFISDMEGASDLYLLSLEDLDRSPVNLSQSGDVKRDQPAWAPDGKWIIYATTEGLRWVSIENTAPGTPHRFTENGRDRGPCFLNEREILFERRSASGTVSLYKGRLGNTTPQRLVDHAAWPTCRP